MLKIVVSWTGEPESISVMRSSGSEKQDAEVIKAVRLCKFTPGSMDEVPFTDEYMWTYEWVADAPNTQLSRCMFGDYPRMSKRRGEEGEALLRLLKKPSGEFEFQLIKSTGHPSLDRESLVFAKHCVEHPAVKADFPVDQAVLQAFHWRLVD